MRRNSSREPWYSRVHQQYIFIALLTCMACNVLHAQAQYTCTIQLKHVAGQEILAPATPYTNAWGEVFTVRNFKYYICNIVLYNGTEQQAFTGTYFLIDEADSASKQLVLNTSLPRVTAIGFLLGVDSLANVSGVQTGVLDPARGMFWTWNTGYVMAKLEGNAAAAHTPQHVFGYHVGGFAAGEAAARNIQLQLPSAMDCTAGKSVTITADILTWFNGKQPVRISETPLCHEPGPLAMRIADNYASMFSISATP